MYGGIVEGKGAFLWFFLSWMKVVNIPMIHCDNWLWSVFFKFPIAVSTKHPNSVSFRDYALPTWMNEYSNRATAVVANWKIFTHFSFTFVVFSFLAGFNIRDVRSPSPRNNEKWRARESESWSMKFHTCTHRICSHSSICSINTAGIRKQSKEREKQIHFDAVSNNAPSTIYKKTNSRFESFVFRVKFATQIHKFTIRPSLSPSPSIPFVCYFGFAFFTFCLNSLFNLLVCYSCKTTSPHSIQHRHTATHTQRRSCIHIHHHHHHHFDCMQCVPVYAYNNIHFGKSRAWISNETFQCVVWTERTLS